MPTADTPTPRTVNDRVDLGIQLLDKELGKAWPYAIDLDRLDLSHAGKCVLGQLTGDYYLGRVMIFTTDRDPTNNHLARRHGFFANTERWGTLTDIWREKIAYLQTTRTHVRNRWGKKLRAWVNREVN